MVGQLITPVLLILNSKPLSENCNMRFARVVKIEENDTEPDQASLESGFTEPPLTGQPEGPELPVHDQNDGTPNDHGYLSSDDEDITDLVRVVLASKQRRQGTLKGPLQKGIHQGTSYPERPRLFACPFWKMDPHTHWDCFAKQLTSISYVKQHLTQCHTPAYYGHLAGSVRTAHGMAHGHSGGAVVFDMAHRVPRSATARVRLHRL